MIQRKLIFSFKGLLRALKSKCLFNQFKVTMYSGKNIKEENNLSDWKQQFKLLILRLKY